MNAPISAYTYLTKKIHKFWPSVLAAEWSLI